MYASAAEWWRMSQEGQAVATAARQWTAAHGALVKMITAPSVQSNPAVAADPCTQSGHARKAVSCAGEDQEAAFGLVPLTCLEHHEMFECNGVRHSEQQYRQKCTLGRLCCLTTVTNALMSCVCWFARNSCSSEPCLAVLAVTHLLRCIGYLAMMCIELVTASCVLYEGSGEQKQQIIALRRLPASAIAAHCCRPLDPTHVGPL
jgi:hypothetical protein